MRKNMNKMTLVAVVVAVMFSLVAVSCTSPKKSEEKGETELPIQYGTDENNDSTIESAESEFATDSVSITNDKISKLTFDEEIFIQDEIHYDGVTIKYNDNSTKFGYAVVSLEDCTVKDLSIPSSIIVNDIEYPVLVVYGRVTNKALSLESVVVPSSIEYIGGNVISFNKNITSLLVDDANATYNSEDNCIIECLTNTLTVACATSSIPDSVETIGSYSCSGADLDTINIGDGVNSIDEAAFWFNESITELTMGTNVGVIGKSAFYSCSSLTTASLSSSLQLIGDNAFTACSSLESIEIPASVSTIGYGVFANCVNLQAVTLASGSTRFSVEDGVLYDSSKTTLIYYPQCKTDTSFTMPSTVTKLAGTAFMNCTALVSINLSSSLITIEQAAFWGCSSLATISIPSTVTSIGGYSFINCTALAYTTENEIKYLGNSENSYLWAICLVSTTASSYSLNSNTIGVAGSAFKGLKTPEVTLTLNDGLKYISNGAFVGGYFESLTIPSSVTSIGDSAFKDCKFLYKIIISSTTIASSITSLYSSAGGLCNYAKTIYIPTSVTATAAITSNYSLGESSGSASIEGYARYYKVIVDDE